MPLNPKSQLEYERKFCDMMCMLGNHAERIASSGKRQLSLCDAALFTSAQSYLTEIKATRAKRFVYEDKKGLITTAHKVCVKPLLAVYFKSSHSSKGKGKWILKVLNDYKTVVRKDDEPDKI